MIAVVERVIRQDTSEVVLSMASTNLDALLDAASRYVRDYHPIGYGTTVSKPKHSDGRWLVQVWRSASCE